MPSRIVIKSLFKIAALASCISLNAAELPGGAPMMAQPKKKSDVKMPSIDEVRSVIGTEFSIAYERAGTPKIAIFWNRKFNDQLSEWDAIFRRSITGEQAVKAQDKFEPQGGDDPAYERNVVGGQKIVAAEYIEKKAPKQRRSGMNEANSFEFSSGYVEPFLMKKVAIIDRQAIMRLVQRDNSREAGTELISDFQKIETDALIGYADYLAEILLTPDSSADAGWSFMVTVKAVSNGQVIAMFKSDGNNPMDPNAKAKWVAAAEGFRKVTPQREIGTPSDVGRQLAYETMQKLSAIW